MAVVITALHGFLGLPSDWNFLRDRGFDVVTPPLDAIPEEGEVLLGYSLGGRLALQALVRGARYGGAVLVSTGISAPDEDRAARDEAWARHFESTEWPMLMKAWNAQPLFGKHMMPRTEGDFDRRELARQLREWSPAVLPGVDLTKLNLPTLWIAGSRDTKYVAEAKRAASLSGGQVWICEGAAHRVPWEQPDAFATRLRDFLGMT